MGVTAGWVIFFALAILLCLVLLFCLFWYGFWSSRHNRSLCPYTGLPLRRATDIAYYSAEKTLRYLYDYHQYDNQIFKLSRAAFCRDTGRIFQDCVTWYDAIIVDWNFLQKRFPGNFVSYGSLNHSQMEAIRNAHTTLEGFQTELSSPTPAPRGIEPEYAYTKPGPLYVDMETKILLGWKIVPGTELEVLIVQKPTKSIPQ